jgi:hypothetical protein
MKLQVQILVILNESHINFHRGERPTVFCLLLLNHLRIPDSLNDLLHRWLEQRDASVLLSEGTFQTVCSTFTTAPLGLQSQGRIKTDTMEFSEGFLSLVVQQDKICYLHQTLVRPAPTPQSNNQKLVAS